MQLCTPSLEGDSCEVAEWQGLGCLPCRRAGIRERALLTGLRSPSPSCPLLWASGKSEPTVATGRPALYPAYFINDEETWLAEMGG